ncbi:hypothetical protein [Streptomyces sp. NBC_01363]|nr:hypothetical protein [Streptomyces sp. NBC_01363]MCX4731390.1 hypothetical protein [Streptomyces sp. NBC_01363]
MNPEPAPDEATHATRAGRLARLVEEFRVVRQYAAMVLGPYA